MIQIHNGQKEILCVKNQIFGDLHYEIEKKIYENKAELSRDKSQVIVALYKCSFGVGFEFHDLFKSKPIALFFVDQMRVAINLIQNSSHPFDSETKAILQNLCQEVLSFAEHLPEKAEMVNVDWRKNTLLNIKCALYEKFERRIALYLPLNSIFKANAMNIQYRLEGGNYGFRIGLEDLFQSKPELLEFAKLVKQSIDDIQRSPAPFDKETEAQFLQFYESLISIANRLEN